MEVIDTSISDVKIIKPKIFGDERGFFLETFEQKRYQERLGEELVFVQDNHSRSQKGVLRGLHFQNKNPQGKLVRVVRGEVYDVAVDIRKESITYGKWFGTILSEENKKQLWIPPGLAHGFVVLSDIADFEYKCTNYYDPKSEECLLWNDPTINIEWPISNPILSNKDKLGKMLTEL
ncbi:MULTISPECIES: dTDP-4-dehydrorhamnose 3,5-epimerase [unclassified Gilliamella]|uniref:dTDP-4-dehydrorhamnose 3,5-epimerase n=1 Tax=unclassified Gilliamella TaxID=2685620 RepID=UPI00226ACC26|nr:MULTISPECIES: dTDP-4-dehydrorhamnose 3,5-epimerase [unclassified Gilliamella]MCX8641183.1 dTDP-4-dehydrorhamnose 3,5-epimerase [Gilliamella sp. B3835]MCX8707058.1 dTDP-4-dehydrorhamnose 3,5-epimerase [Gilliamella sp. B3783]MCX8710445.1 dTDP-4-dehydrorhamnose 3,5-epimerase [Gilliamella sp. B3780]MCX8715127.1 dTDP-4-dehydrorhamnose 3,5-epimerase [Gilliamella sp. B3781]MCX8716041.1 dTDP-4-dehydrorhamnose 3,5-epimerase [Gilliamella sp. B3784]